MPHTVEGGAERFHVWMSDEEGVQHVATVKDALFDQRIERDGLLETGGRHVLPVLQLELRLYTTGDREVAVLGQFSEVARTEGSGFDDDLRRSIVVPIAHHDVWTRDHDFSFIGPLRVVPCIRVDGDLYAVGNSTNGVEFTRTWPDQPLAETNGEVLPPVAFVAVEADHLDKRSNVGRKGCSPGHAKKRCCHRIELRPWTKRACSKACQRSRLGAQRRTQLRPWRCALPQIFGPWSRRFS